MHRASRHRLSLPLPLCGTLLHDATLMRSWMRALQFGEAVQTTRESTAAHERTSRSVAMTCSAMTHLGLGSWFNGLSLSIGTVASTRCIHSSAATWKRGQTHWGPRPGRHPLAKPTRKEREEELQQNLKQLDIDAYHENRTYAINLTRAINSAESLGSLYKIVSIRLTEMNEVHCCALLRSAMRILEDTKAVAGGYSRQGRKEIAVNQESSPQLLEQGASSAQWLQSAANEADAQKSNAGILNLEAGHSFTLSSDHPSAQVGHSFPLSFSERMPELETVPAAGNRQQIDRLAERGGSQAQSHWGSMHWEGPEPDGSLAFNDSSSILPLPTLAAVLASRNASRASVTGSSVGLKDSLNKPPSSAVSSPPVSTATSISFERSADSAIRAGTSEPSFISIASDRSSTIASTVLHPTSSSVAPSTSELMPTRDSSSRDSITDMLSARSGSEHSSASLPASARENATSRSENTSTSMHISTQHGNSLPHPKEAGTSASHSTLHSSSSQIDPGQTTNRTPSPSPSLTMSSSAQLLSIANTLPSQAVSTDQLEESLFSVAAMPSSAEPSQSVPTPPSLVGSMHQTTVSPTVQSHLSSAASTDQSTGLHTSPTPSSETLFTDQATAHQIAEAPQSTAVSPPQSTALQIFVAPQSQADTTDQSTALVPGPAAVALLQESLEADVIALVRPVVTRLASLTSRVGPEGTSGVLWALARLRLVDSGAIYRLCLQAHLNVPETRPNAIASTLWSLASLHAAAPSPNIAHAVRVSTKIFFGAASPALRHNISALTPSALAGMAWAMTSLRLNDCILADRVSMAAAAIVEGKAPSTVPSFPVPVLARTLASLATWSLLFAGTVGNHRARRVWDASAPRIVKLLTDSHSPPSAWANVIWGFGSERYFTEALFTAAGPHLLQLLPRFTPHQLANTVVGYANVAYTEDITLLTALTAALGVRAHELGAWDLGHAAWALAALHASLEAAALDSSAVLHALSTLLSTAVRLPSSEYPSQAFLRLAQAALYYADLNCSRTQPLRSPHRPFSFNVNIVPEALLQPEAHEEGLEKMPQESGTSTTGGTQNKSASKAKIEDQLVPSLNVFIPGVTKRKAKTDSESTQPAAAPASKDPTAPMLRSSLRFLPQEWHTLAASLARKLLKQRDHIVTIHHLNIASALRCLPEVRLISVPGSSRDRFMVADISLQLSSGERIAIMLDGSEIYTWPFEEKRRTGKIVLRDALLKRRFDRVLFLSQQDWNAQVKILDRVAWIAGHIGVKAPTKEEIRKRQIRTATADRSKGIKVKKVIKRRKGFFAAEKKPNTS